jgi:hypothetical protein
MNNVDIKKQYYSQMIEEILDRFGGSGDDLIKHKTKIRKERQYTECAKKIEKGKIVIIEKGFDEDERCWCELVVCENCIEIALKEIEELKNLTKELTKMNFNRGDYVKLKPFGWYYEHKDLPELKDCEDTFDYLNNNHLFNCVFTINQITNNRAIIYHNSEDTGLEQVYNLPIIALEKITTLDIGNTVKFNDPTLYNIYNIKQGFIMTILEVIVTDHISYKVLINDVNHTIFNSNVLTPCAPHEILNNISEESTLPPYQGVNYLTASTYLKDIPLSSPYKHTEYLKDIPLNKDHSPHQGVNPFATPTLTPYLEIYYHPDNINNDFKTIIHTNTLNYYTISNPNEKNTSSIICHFENGTNLTLQNITLCYLYQGDKVITLIDNIN